MNELRVAFLAAAGAARPVLAHPDVEDRWTQPSALAEMSVRGLCGHLVRAVTTVEGYLAHNVTSHDDPISPVLYWASIADTDVHSPLNRSIRERGEEAAKAGHTTLVRTFDETVERLSVQMHDEPPDRRVQVVGDRVMLLDDYLVTRIVELVVHTDDLCVSLGHETPALPGADIAIRTLVDVAEYRHGETAVLRALTRRERDAVEALRVL